MVEDRQNSIVTSGRGIEVSHLPMSLMELLLNATIIIKVLVLLLRLRQICSHPSLIQEDGVAYIGSDELFEDIKAEFAIELMRIKRLYVC